MTTLGIGTEKGAYLVRSDDRRSWQVEGPLFPGWKVTAFGRAPDGTHLLAVGSNWFGAAVHRSRDLAEWEQVDAGPAYEDTAGRKLEQIWTLHTDGDTVLAGVADAGLFRSDDQGSSWQPVPGLNEHASRPGWSPGFGGLAAHRILTSGDRWWVGISAVGVFRSEDAGASFGRYDAGVPAAGAEEEGAEADGWCVHCIVADPDDPDRIWRQDHVGVFRTSDGGDSWERIEEGLPSGFGFPIVRDHATGRLFVVPLHSDRNRVPVDGRFAVHRSDDDGDTWQVSGTGFPDEPTFTGVLRGAMTADQHPDGCGVYLGTTSGDVWASVDSGDSWTRLPGTYPRIAAVAVLE